MQQTTEKKPTIAALQAIIDELQLELAHRGAQLKEQQQGFAQLARQHEELRKQLSAKDEENDRLRDELHLQTITIARLEGYRDRVLEFDPVTERQVYLDEGGELAFDEHRGAPPSFVTRRKRHASNRYNEGPQDFATGNAGTPWYRRRG